MDNSHNKRLSVFIINNVNVKHIGNYTCIATNPAGKDSFSSELKVRGPPRWIDEPQDITISIGKKASIRCSASGYPKPEIHWKRNSGVVAGDGFLTIPNTGRVKMNKDGALVIDSVVSEDAGYYTCQASTGVAADLNKTVLLTVRGAPKLQPFIFPKTLSEGQTVKAICALIVGERPLHFQWLKNGYPMTEVPKVTIKTFEDYSLLEVITVGEDDNGNYTCIVRNHHGSDQFTASLTIPVAPKWIKEPTTGIVSVDSSVTFDCVIGGYPKPTVSWKFLPAMASTTQQYLPITSKERFRVEKNGSLIITRVHKEDAGKYQCTASNGIGNAVNKIVTLFLHVPARFEEKFHVERVHRGDSVKLECDALGDNPMTITWNKDNERLSRVDSGRYQIFDRITEGGTLSEIQVHGVDHNDNGIFTCLAKNTYGEDQRRIKLIVLEPPSAPSDVRVDQTWSRSVRITWMMPYSGNSPVNKYIIQYWQNQGAPHRLEEETVSSAQTSIILYMLQPGTSYIVRVMAENDVGKGTPSENRRFLTSEEEPSASPTDVSVEARGAGTLHVKWKAPPKDQWNGQLKGYYVGYKETGSTDSYTYKHVTFSEGLSEEYFLQHLRKNTAYGITVVAFNSAGRGSESQEIVKITKDTDPPSAPSLRVTAQSETSITIKWRQNKGDADMISHYILFYKENSNTWTEVTIPHTKEKEYVLRSLRPGSIYCLYLQAASQKGNSNPSETLTVRTDGAVGPMEWNLHAVISGEEELPEYLRLPVLAPVSASVAIVILVIIVSCMAVKKEQARYNRDIDTVTEKIYPYSMNGTPPQRYVDVEKTRSLLQHPPPPPPFPLPPPPSDGYPAPYDTLPLNDANNSTDRRRNTGRGSRSNEGSVDSRRQGDGNVIQERAEVHNYDHAA
ncbi:cell adhesion molecule Dscam1-like isoform X1 [Tachypleus tridentatus]|uniref:cell adhesion molecule Dscam1-like isoform X1 n=1 Tax=Tachypleus tridentatus TaxID=6853 RepID=UPI003FD1FF23